MDKIYRVFISSTYEDLKEERKEVTQALLEMDCFPTGMELFQASNETQWELIKRVIDSCDYYIVIIAGRYGSVHKETKKSYTQMECEYALESGIPILGFIRRDLDSLPHNKVDDLSKVKQFIKIVKQKEVKYWSTPHELAGAVSRAMHHATENYPRIGWVRDASKSREDDINQHGCGANIGGDIIASVPHQYPECEGKVFIVHGHDEKAVYELKDYLQNTLKFAEPTVLSSVAGKSRTVIETFEEEAAQASLVFVLMTPDDAQGDGRLRARQNVVFELGYFLGRLGRRSGRTIVLLRGDVELPSDIRGMLYIRFDHGILAAGEEIRRAIEAVAEND